MDLSHFQVVFFERLGDILIMIILLKAYSRRDRLMSSSVQYCIVLSQQEVLPSLHNLNHLYYKQLSVSQSCFVYFPFQFENNKSVKCPDYKNLIILRAKIRPVSLGFNIYLLSEFFEYAFEYLYQVFNFNFEIVKILYQSK